MINQDFEKQKDIRVVSPNLKGSDKVIGDVHGNSRTLKAVLASLDDNDRLFIIGDLIDRGSDNVGVLDLIIENKDRVFVILGNHELLFLETLAALERIALKKPFLLDQIKKEILEENGQMRFQLGKELLNDPDVHSVIFHAFYNGGTWICHLFLEELQNQKIKTETHNEDEIITYDSNSRLKMYEAYIRALPFIIHVTGEKPFNLVHSDMPINDEELQHRIKQNRVLSQYEKEYATWAREKDPMYPIQSMGRTEQSILTIVGHNIIDRPGVKAVRRETNTIDIDVATYINNLSLVVNVTNGTSGFIGSNPSTTLISAQQEITTHLSRLSSHAEHKVFKN